MTDLSSLHGIGVVNGCCVISISCTWNRDDVVRHVVERCSISSRELSSTRAYSRHDLTGLH